jgi:benzylsuccinate CoA-transferase BbsE subunit
MAEAEEEQREGALDDLKVLDLAGPIGVYCAKLLADLGADVIQVEPPGGDPMRKLGPFYGDDSDPQKSLYWWHFNTSKRGITLDVEKPEGQALFRRLVGWADVAVESFPPGYLGGLGLGYEALHELNPGLILTSITPFGQTGPYSHFKGPDIVGQAMSGVMHQVGSPDRPPYLIASEAAYWCASTLAANATMLALAFRDMNGQGQHVDASMQQAMALGAGNPMPTYDILGQVLRRGELARGRGSVRPVYPCKDGHVYFLPAAPGTSMEAVRDLLDEHGLGSQFDPRWLDATVVREDLTERQRFEALMTGFFARFTKWELLDMSFNREKQVFTVPTDTPKDIANSPHLIARGFIQDIEHPELERTIRYPGPPYRLPESPWRIARRAPLIGEHNYEIYHDVLGLDEDEIARLERDGVV